MGSGLNAFSCLAGPMDYKLPEPTRYTVTIDCHINECEHLAIVEVESEYDSPTWAIVRYLCEQGHSLKDLDPAAEGWALEAAMNRVADRIEDAREEAIDRAVDEMRGN